MDITRILTLPVLLAALATAPAWAQSSPAQGATARGLTEIPDAELDAMRGRYTVGNNAVLWFGVTMVSTWQTQAGQAVQGQLNVGFDFSAGAPSVSFVPSVSITVADAPLSAPQGQRSVDTAGLDNVSGLVQAVQVAGDGNAASNLTTLTVRDGEAPAAGLPLDSAHASASLGGVSASAGFDGTLAQVLLQVEGHGVARQWLRPGSLGQSIALTSDGQRVSNQLHMELVRHSLPSSAALDQGVAQAISLTRGLGGI